VHADSSNFAAGVGKKEAYEQVIEQATALFDGQRNWVCCVVTIDNHHLTCANNIHRSGKLDVCSLARSVLVH
jgi:hypothetical protein